MDINTLLERLGGDILANKARATVDGKIIDLAVLCDQSWVWTDAGSALMAKHSNMLAEEQPDVLAEKAPRKASRKAATQPVELLDIDPADFAELEE